MGRRAAPSRAHDWRTGSAPDAHATRRLWLASPRRKLCARNAWSHARDAAIPSRNPRRPPPGQGRDRAARWRERHAAEIAALRSPRAAAEIELAALRDAAVAAIVDTPPLPRGLSSGTPKLVAAPIRGTCTSLSSMSSRRHPGPAPATQGWIGKRPSGPFGDRVAHHARAIQAPETCASSQARRIKLLD